MSTPSPQADRRRSRSLASRQSLIEATVRSIATRGLEATTLGSVSELSGLSRGLVAFHFASKDALIRAALEAANARYAASWQRHVRSPPLRGAQRLAAAIAHDIAFGERHPELLSLWYALWGEARGQAIYRELALPGDRRYVEEIALMLREVPADPALAPAVNAMLLGHWLDAHLAAGEADWVAAREAGRALLSAILRSEAPPLPDLLLGA